MSRHSAAAALSAGRRACQLILQPQSSHGSSSITQPQSLRCGWRRTTRPRSCLPRSTLTLCHSNTSSSLRHPRRAGRGPVPQRQTRRRASSRCWSTPGTASRSSSFFGTVSSRQARRDCICSRGCVLPKCWELCATSTDHASHACHARAGSHHCHTPTHAPGTQARVSGVNLPLIATTTLELTPTNPDADDSLEGELSSCPDAARPGLLALLDAGGQTLKRPLLLPPAPPSQTTHSTRRARRGAVARERAGRTQHPSQKPGTVGPEAACHALPLLLLLRLMLSQYLHAACDMPHSKWRQRGCEQGFFYAAAFLYLPGRKLLQTVGQMSKAGAGFVLRGMGGPSTEPWPHVLRLASLASRRPQCARCQCSASPNVQGRARQADGY